MTNGYPIVGTDFGDFRIEGELGRGGMGVVYAAVHRRTQRRVALKVLAPHFADSAEYVDRFRAEADLLLRIDSPHITQVFDHGEHDGLLYLVTQVVLGGDLAQRLRASGPMLPDTALDITAQLADALSDAHRAGVLHRDVKPNNVLLGESGGEPFAYLCDFGVAKAEGADDGLTVTGNVAGSWGFMAPERTRGEPATRAADLYSLGCLLWTMATGAQPYTGSGVTVAMAHQQRAIPQFEATSAVAREINHLLIRSMAKDPSHRYASADEMKAEVLASRARLRSGGGLAVASAGPVGAFDAVSHDAPTVFGASRPSAAAAPAPFFLSESRGSGRGGMLGLVAALALVLALVAGASWWLVQRAGDEDGALAADGSRQSPASSPPQGGVGPSGSPSGAASPSDTATSGASPDPLGVGVPEEDQDCSGEYLVALASSDSGTSDSAAVVRDALARFPGVPDPKYLDTAASCSSLTALDGKAALSYLPYLGPYADAKQACAARMAYLDTTTYVAPLDATATAATWCMCSYSASDLPDLNPVDDETAVGDRKFWGVELQYALNGNGYPITGPLSGNFGPQSTARVSAFQADYGLAVTGAMDAETWAAVAGVVCG